MLKFDFPVCLALQPLVEGLLECNVDIYTSGDLGDGLLYVDIGHRTAARVTEHLSASWTLIYPYFLLSHNNTTHPMCIMSSDEIKKILRVTLSLEETSEDIFQDNINGAMVHIEYLLNCQPNRLVYVDGCDIAKKDIQELLALIAL